MRRAVQQLEVSVDEEGMRLDRWLRGRFPGLPQSRIEKLLRSGAIRVEGGRARSSRRLAAGETVDVPDLKAAPRAKPARPASAGPLEGSVLHRDDWIIAINKPSGLAVQGGTGLASSVDRLAWALVGANEEPPRLVHRIDRETSGVLLMARHRRAAAEIAAAFRRRRVEKVYWAAVVGRMAAPEGELRGNVRRAAGKVERTMEVVERAEEAGREGRGARTAYRILATAGHQASWVELRPSTGRTHQIRAQLASAGQPIVGDRRYGGQAAGGMGQGMHLHARAVSLEHPAGGRLEVVAPLPEHMHQTWNLLGWDEEGEK